MRARLTWYLTGLFAVLALFAVRALAQSEAFDEADAKLNHSYQLTLDNSPPAARLALRQAQRAWIAGRDARCGRRLPSPCALQLTRQRTTELVALLERSDYFRRVDDRSLIQLWYRADAACNGDDIDGPVCGHRERLTDELESRGWCWGPDSAVIEAERGWVRAGRSCRIP